MKYFLINKKYGQKKSQKKLGNAVAKNMDC